MKRSKLTIARRLLACLIVGCVLFAVPVAAALLLAWHPKALGPIIFVAVIGAAFVWALQEIDQG